ncbi:hypothetical protein [Flavobacterium hydrophilum]|uniref:Uncharacterized protein n=1 Tax=Flavobacterium hydrophilum TaxID=2211445 RepID=A0A2V4C659_9FLAO|nr:hypothetical protein [Flavobacterium hydrophilum]PXY46809.1 hypothetical protein DMB68_06535 [Flavobacterium hydrophilum]
MNTHADIRQDNKSQSAANAISKKQGNGVSTFQLVDNRPKQIAQLPKKDLITPTPSVFQLQKLEAGKLNVVGEHHTESNNRRSQEKDIAAREVGGGYWTEDKFRIRETKSSKENAVKDTAQDQRILGDALYLRIAESIQYVDDAKNEFEQGWTQWTSQKLSGEQLIDLKAELQTLLVTCKTHTLEANRLAEAYMHNEEFKTLPKFVTAQIIQIHKLLPETEKLFLILVETWKKHSLQQLIFDRFLNSFHVFGSNIDVLNMYAAKIGGASRTDTSKLRSYEMDNAASFAHDRIGVWKIGFDHVEHIEEEMQQSDTKNYVLINRDEFNHEYKELPILVEDHMVKQEE